MKYAAGVLSNSLGSPRSGAPQVGLSFFSTLKALHNFLLIVERFQRT